MIVTLPAIGRALYLIIAARLGIVRPVTTVSVPQVKTRPTSTVLTAAKIATLQQVSKQLPELTITPLSEPAAPATMALWPRANQPTTSPPATRVKIAIQPILGLMRPSITLTSAVIVLLAITA